MHLPVTRATASCAAALACLLIPAAALAQEARSALFVTVQNPLTSDAVTRIKNQIDLRTNEGPAGADGAPSRQIDTVVFDFNPGGKPASTTDSGPCRDLSKYIVHLNRTGRTRTYAFVHAPATGYTVLPVLTCKELVMGKGGVLGPIVTEGVKDLTAGEQTDLREWFGRESHWPAVQKMFDPNVVLRKGPPREGSGRIFVDARDEKALARIAGKPELVSGAQDGQLASYAARDARDAVELAKAADVNTRKDVAELYNLPPSSVRDDPLGGRTPLAFQWTLKGDVDGAMRESANRVLRDVRKKGGNILILVLNCDGTDLDAARGLAEDLAKAQSGDDPLLVIAFVPETAPNAAAVVALGCSEIVMTRPKEAAEGEAKEADFGNFERFVKTSKQPAVDAQKKSLREFAEGRGYPGVLVEGMLDRNLEVVRARGLNNNRNKTRLLSRKEFDDLQKEQPNEWALDKVVKQPGVPFHPGATLAAELGLARFTVPTTSVKDVCKIYGVADAKSPDPGLIDKFAEFLRIPAVTIILVMVGFIGLILELKVPGLTVPGIVAALCFVLVFWSQSQFSGEMFVLALLLFLLGLVLIGLEIFVLPGFGVCGICGILFMLAGLGLVTLEKAPEGRTEWVEFGVKVSLYLFAMMGAMVLAFVIAKFLPQVPYANRLLLAPPGEQPQSAEPSLPGAVEAAELLGAIGASTTALRPAGVVRFGDKFVDVVSDGGFIPSGSRVQVIAVEGTRIVVKEV